MGKQTTKAEFDKMVLDYSEENKEVTFTPRKETKGDIYGISILREVYKSWKILKIFNKQTGGIKWKKQKQKLT